MRKLLCLYPMIRSNFKISVTGNVVEVVIQGIFGMSIGRRYLAELKKTVKAFKGAPWAALIDVREWELSSADIEPLFIEIGEWCSRRSHHFDAYILGEENAALKSYYLEKYVLPQDPTATKQLFTDKPDAVSWLAKSGFSPYQQHSQSASVIALDKAINAKSGNAISHSHATGAQDKTQSNSEATKDDRDNDRLLSFM